MNNDIIMSEACEKISVIVPVYNVEKYLEDSVRSIMNQTYRNLEIICVNDGSTDGSSEILHRLQKEDERIVIVDKPNGGLGDARNAGLEHVTSEWISFVDSDDTLRTDAYEIIARAIGENPDMVHFGIEMVHEKGVKPIASDERYYAIRYKGLVEVKDMHIINSDVAACNKVFRKSLLDKYNIRFEKIYYEDFSFTLQYLAVSKTVYYIKDKLYKYLRRRGSIMAETFKKTPRAIDHIYAYGYVYEFMQKYNLLEAHRECLTVLFPGCYWFAINHGTSEIIPAVEEYATKLYKSSPILSKELNRVLVFSPKNEGLRKRASTKLLEKIFAIRNERMNDEVYKVVRLLGIAVYKKSK